MPDQDYEFAVREAEAALQRAKVLLLAELAAYPTPISGCDQQYVRLVSDRTRIIRTINSLNDQPFVAMPRVLEVGAAPEVR